MQNNFGQRGTLRKFQSAPAIAGGRCEIIMTIYIYDNVSIRARHCWRAMRVGHGKTYWPQQFQSAPAIAGGRCPRLLFTSVRELSVSIRARHCWRAMRFQPKTLKRLNFFTISREQGAMNWDCSIHHVEKIRKSIQINGLRSARTS